MASAARVPATSPNVIVLKKNQFRIFNDPTRYRVVVAGRRFGKSYLAVAEMMRVATCIENSNIWYIAPTYRQAKMIVWKVLKSIIGDDLRESTNEQELSMVLKNGSEVSLKGADNPDSLRGAALNLVVFDEYQDIDPAVWSKVVRPMLATTRGRALFIGTPKGYNHFYDLYMEAMSEKNKHWRAYHYTTVEGGYVSLEEVMEAKNDPTITEKEFKQEFEASFETLTGRVYENFDRTKNIKTIEYKGGTILVGMDFNLDPMTASIAQKAAKEIQFFDEISIANSNTQEMCDELKRRYPASRCVIYPDPAGDSGSTKAPVGTTDYTILRKAGFRVYDPGRAYKIVDRINTVNAALKNAAGVRAMFFDPSCRKLIKAFDGLCYKEGTKIPEKNGLDHYCDNAGYLVMGVAPLRNAASAKMQRFRP